ncbi:MAG: class I SAM-dependent RNA methyltransferase [Leptospiraceae bacterium]|nr:class I SAM-dependent RNA methyltransferase [Leptospiraceae bacterium]MCP5497238.1 class I SAM-dependent RNA methyltransferase [Leptospiraceae bacterium]
MEQQEFILQAVKWVNQGYALGYYNDQTYFISGAIPGEIVRAKLVYQNSKFKHLVVTVVLEASEFRIQNDCPIFLECGGCSFRHILYSYELDVKKELLKKELKKEEEIPVYSDSSEKYRNNVQITVENNKKGFFKEHSNQVVEHPNTGCKHLPDELNDFIKKHTPQSSQKSSLKLRFDGKIVTNYEKEPTQVFIKNLKIQIPPNGFFQINRFLLEKWIDDILTLLVGKKDQNLLELFCGSGLLGLLCAQNFSRVIGYEVESLSVQYAKKNAKTNHIVNADFISKNLYTQKIHKEHGEYPIWLANPPRNGFGKLLLEQILYYKPQILLYSSCNYVSLSSDIRKLLKDYDIAHLSMYDFFPRTPYFETLALLNIRSSH